MDKDQDYPSDSDESDQDFCPEDESESDVEESDHKGSDSEVEEDIKKNSKKKSKRNKGKSKIKEIENDSIEEKKENDPVDEEEEKKRSDDLWASFLSDVNGTTDSTSTSETSSKKPEKEIKNKRNDVELKKQNEVQNDEGLKKVKVTEILEFAGEKIEVIKEVVADTEIEESRISKNINKPSNNLLNKFSKVPPLKRSSVGGLSSVLGQIGKKSKLSVLEKTKLDWDGFKKNEGLNEELKTFNKGKDGYLERQDFLQRTDVRQFEIEKSLRQTKRKY